MTGTNNAHEEVQVVRTWPLGAQDIGAVAFGGGIWKVKFVPSSAFFHPQGGEQAEEKAHLQAALLTQSLGTLRPGARVSPFRSLTAQMLRPKAVAQSQHFPKGTETLPCPRVAEQGIRAQHQGV